MADLISYEARVHAGGYEWMTPLRRERRIRAPWNALGPATPRLVLVAKGPPHRTFSPTDKDSALFRNFATTNPTPDEVLKFASLAGPLWDELNEPFEEWEYEIRTMRFLIELWDAIRSDRRAGAVLAQFRTAKGCRVKFSSLDTLLGYEPWSKQRTAIDYFKKSIEPTLYTTHHKTPKEAASSYLMQAVNERLWALSTPQALLCKDGHYRMTMQPRHLLGALWFQFASSISGEKKYRGCVVCDRAIELSPESNRADKRYCSDACRSRAFRRRQKEA